MSGNRVSMMRANLQCRRHMTIEVAVRRLRIAHEWPTLDSTTVDSAHLGEKIMRNGYLKFAAMILASFVVMYVLMYLNTFRIAHVEFSQTRMWMAVLMAATMAVVMLAFMHSMYSNRKLNIPILVSAVIAILGSLALVRSQRTVADVSYLEAMIPHHSIAVLTSTRARIHDPRVRRLADGILEAQVREIAEMQALIADLRRNPPPADAPVLVAENVGQ